MPSKAWVLQRGGGRAGRAVEGCLARVAATLMCHQHLLPLVLLLLVLLLLVILLLSSCSSMSFEVSPLSPACGGTSSR